MVIKTFFLFFQVFERFARNLINIGRQHTSRRQSEEGVGFLQQAIEFLSTIKPDDIENEIFRVRLYLYMGVNIKKVSRDNLEFDFICIPQRQYQKFNIGKVCIACNM